MTLENFIKLYNGNACITIDGYCEEQYYDYINLPHWILNYELSDSNSNLHISSCLFQESWWQTVKEKEVFSFSIIGHGMGKTELYITLKK